MRQVDLLSCMAHDILQFLQEMLEVGKSPSTLRGIVTAIKAAMLDLGKWQRVIATLLLSFLKVLVGLLPITECHTLLYLCCA